MTVLFYGRPNCALCDEGKKIMAIVAQDLALNVAYINIEEDDQVHEKYMLMIPVVVKGEKVVQYGQLDYLTLLDGCSDGL